jgi:hypothetical protein
MSEEIESMNSTGARTANLLTSSPPPKSRTETTRRNSVAVGPTAEPLFPNNREHLRGRIGEMVAAPDLGQLLFGFGQARAFNFGPLLAAEAFVEGNRAAVRTDSAFQPRHRRSDAAPSHRLRGLGRSEAFDALEEWCGPSHSPRRGHNFA